MSSSPTEVTELMSQPAPLESDSSATGASKWKSSFRSIEIDLSGNQLFESTDDATESSSSLADVHTPDNSAALATAEADDATFTAARTVPMQPAQANAKRQNAAATAAAANQKRRLQGDAAAKNQRKTPTAAAVARKPHRWGEFDERHEPEPSGPIDFSENDALWLHKMEHGYPQEQPTVRLTMDNAIVTQSIELQDQTDMIQTLIDMYTSKNTGDPCQLMPQIDFPPDTTDDLLRTGVDGRFLKPLWYIPPPSADGQLARAEPTRLSASVVRRALRKSVAGLLRLNGYHESTYSALMAITDGLDEFMRSFMAKLTDTVCGEARDLQHATQLDVVTLERGYFALRSDSLLSLHNYYKHDVVRRNRTEHREFQEIYTEYDRLRHESQQLPTQHQQMKNDEYMHLSDYTGGGGGVVGTGSGMVLQQHHQQHQHQQHQQQQQPQQHPNEPVFVSQQWLGNSGGGGVGGGVVGVGVVRPMGTVNVFNYFDGSAGDPSVSVGTAGFQALFDANAMVGPSNATTGEEFQLRYGAAAANAANSSVQHS